MNLIGSGQTSIGGSPIARSSSFLSGCIGMAGDLCASGAKEVGSHIRGMLGPSINWDRQLPVLQSVAASAFTARVTKAIQWHSPKMIPGLCSGLKTLGPLAHRMEQTIGSEE